MNSRYNTHHSINARFLNRAIPVHSKNHPSCSAHPNKADIPDVEVSESGIPVTELIGFSLTCIERLTYPRSNSDDQIQPLEQRILLVVAEKLPSYMRLKANLHTTLRTHPKHDVRSSQQQYRVAELRRRVANQENAIAQQLVATGEDIGLPQELLGKIAKLTKTILERCTS